MTRLSLRRRVKTSSLQRQDKSIHRILKLSSTQFLLSCIHRWWHNNQLLKGESTILNDKQVQNILHLKRLNRTDLLSSFMCHSSNNNITDPITASVMIDLNCKFNNAYIVFWFEWFNYLPITLGHEKTCHLTSHQLYHAFTNNNHSLAMMDILLCSSVGSTTSPHHGRLFITQTSDIY